MDSSGPPFAWSLDPWTIAAIACAAFVYGRGVARLRVEQPGRFGGARPVAFHAGLAVVFVAIASPLDALADWLLQAHMVQHWLLMMVAPPLVWLGAPTVPLLRGLPTSWLRDGGGPFLAWPVARRTMRVLTTPGVSTALLVVVILFWHVPTAYTLALRAPFWHDVEHACFFWAGLLFWYPIVAPWPARRGPSPAGRLLVLVAFMLLNGLFSATFALSSQVFYPAYTDAPRLAGISPLEDQNAAGAFMWVAGSLTMAVAAVALLIPWLDASPSSAQTREAPRPRPRREARPGLLDAPRLARLVRGRRALRIVLFALAALVVVDGFLGPSRPSGSNLAGVVPWTYFRPLTVLALILAGNLFCGVCPMIASRDLAGRLLGRPLSWPRWLRGRWLAAALFALYLLAYEVFAIWDSPAATAWLVVGYFVAAFLVEVLFPRGTFCRHVCPIGQFQFVGATVAPRSVQAVDDAVCAGCRTHDCLRGNETAPGCPTGLFLPTKAGGLDCTLCLDCVRACPHENVGWVSIPRSRPLGLGRSVRERPAPDLRAMWALFVFAAFVNAAAMTSPVESWLASLSGLTGARMAGALEALVLAVVLVPLPIGIAFGAAWTTDRLAGPTDAGRGPGARFVSTLVPLGVSMWLAHFVLHLLAGPASGWLALRRMATDLAQGTFGEGSDAGAFAMAMTMPAPSFSPEPWLLAIGLVASVSAAWRLARATTATPAAAIGAALPWAVLAALLHLAGVWILRQPMSMRGMWM